METIRVEGNPVIPAETVDALRNKATLAAGS
jgi:hypothetical protein